MVQTIDQRRRTSVRLFQSWRELDRTATRVIALGSVFALSSFMLTPLLAVILTKYVGLSVPLAGVVVAICTFLQFSGSVFGGSYVEAWGPRAAMLFGLSLRVAGLLLILAASLSSVLGIAGALVSSVSSAFYMPANKALVVLRTPVEDRALSLSLSDAGFTAGMACGPLVATLLLASGADTLLFATAALFVGLIVVHATILGYQREAPGAKGGSWSPNYKDLPLGSFGVIVASAVLYFYFQNFLSLYAESRHALWMVSVCFGVNTLATFVLQPLLARRIQASSWRAVAVVSPVAMGAGFASLATGRALAVVVGVLVFSLAEIYVFLKSDLVMVAHFDPHPGIAFGVQRFGMGVGGLGSGILGGLIFARTGARPTFWLACAAQSVVVSALGFLIPPVETDRTGETL